MTRVWSWDFFQDGVSVSSDAGRAFLAARMDEMDTDINTAWGHFNNGNLARRQIEVWKRNANLSISNNVTTTLNSTHTAVMQKAGDVAAFSVNSSTGAITFTSAGIYKVTFNIVLQTGLWTEGELRGGFMSIGGRFQPTMAINQYLSTNNTTLNFTTYLEVNSTSADITPGAVHTWQVYQFNSSSASATFLAANSWFAVEYTDAYRQG